MSSRGVERTKKTIVIVTVLLLVAIIGFVICKYFFDQQTMISIPREEITNIMITNGTNGNTSELDSKGIDEIYNICSSINLSKIGKVDSTGWTYNIDVYKGEEVVDSVTLVSDIQCTISGFKYAIEEKKGTDLIELIKKYADNRS